MCGHDEPSIWRKRRGSVQHLQNLLRSGRPVRVPVPDFRPAPIYSPRWSAPSETNRSTARRYARRPSKLTPAQESAIRSLAATRSLRSLAVDFAVSYETIRTVIQSAKKA